MEWQINCLPFSLYYGFISGIVKHIFTEDEKMNYLVVVDMQNDFIDMALGTKEAVAIVPKVKEKIQNFDGKVIFTRDTHTFNYPDTQEGRKLPVPHCIIGTEGWEITPELKDLVEAEIIDKPGFGSVELAMKLADADADEDIESITLCGLCTDICVISNAMLLKAYLPEVEIIVDSSCSAGVTPESHETALKAMAACQITIL